jgi:hypothetical protein
MRLLRVLVRLFIHATISQPMTVVTQLLAQKRYRSRISLLLPLPVWQVSTIDCPATPQWPMPTASDLCDQSVTVAQVGDETSSGTCPVVYTRNYIATDDCGNTATCSRAFRFRISPLRPLPVWQVSPSTVLLLHNGQCLPLLIFVIWM